MVILGLHFGHDAGVAVLKDGKLLSYILRERQSRIKRALSLQVANIMHALEAAQVGLDEIDYCAITSTQHNEIIIDEPQRFEITLEPHAGHTFACLTQMAMRNANRDPASMMGGDIRGYLYDVAKNPEHRRHLLRYFPEAGRLPAASFGWFGYLDNYASSPHWSRWTLQELAGRDLRILLGAENLRGGLHYPVTLRLDGRLIPAYFINHQAAHAGSVYARSGLRESAILTHDGFYDPHGYQGGMFWYARGQGIYPLAPAYMVLGPMYQNVGYRLGLGTSGQEGKLMGLASYGKPRFYDERITGNAVDLERNGLTAGDWFGHCVETAKELGYDMAPLGDPSRITEPVNADIAASTQKVFEEGYLRAVDSLYKMLGASGVRTGNLCLSGGCALNCPTNTRVANESAFAHVYVEPGCDDSGIAYGAAAYLYHSVMDFPLPAPDSASYATPYVGPPPQPGRIEAALRSFASQVDYAPCADGPGAAADDLAADRVIGWFEGRSELGPRALGHRSILADPRNQDNWRRVNVIKGREAWRPLAPSVLQSEALRWFGGIRVPSPYMLFNAAVLSDRIPAVTHVDGSARVQTVDVSCGGFYHLLCRFFEITGVPVVLNTSFNGRGQPMVESAEDALKFLVESTLDAVYIEGFRVTRKA